MLHGFLCFMDGFELERAIRKGMLAYHLCQRDQTYHKFKLHFNSSVFNTQVFGKLYCMVIFAILVLVTSQAAKDKPEPVK